MSHCTEQQSGEPTAESVDNFAVDVFSRAMKAKMAFSRENGRSGWNEKNRCTRQDLSRMLKEHVEKGDPVDVANFCMMIWNRGERIV